nr:MAG TPA: hypothetical protein [Caudoviricetes sp.]
MHSSSYWFGNILGSKGLTRRWSGGERINIYNPPNRKRGTLLCVNF